jgi:hypothetical protein
VFRKNNNAKIDSVVARFEDHYDDSSDEEEVSSSLSAFNANKQWLALQDDLKAKTKNPLDNDYLLSFAAHAAGNQIYHSEAVGHLYYDLKKRILQPNNSQAATQTLKDAINAAVQKSMAELFLHLQKFIVISAPDKAKMVEKSLSIVNTAVSSKLAGLIDSSLPIMIGYINALRISKKHGSAALDEARNEVEKTEAGMVDLLSTSIAMQLKLPTDVGTRKAVMVKANEAIAEEISSLFVKLKLTDKRNLKGKEDALAALAAYQGPYQRLVMSLKVLLESCAANGKVSTMLEAKIAGNRDLLMTKYLDDLIDVNQGRVAGEKLNKREADIFSKYFSYDSGSVDDELRRTFSVLLKRNLYDALHSLQRRTLGGAHEFVSENPYHFYANLRLSNRSQKRSILNSKAKFFKNDSVARSWKLNAGRRQAVVEVQNLTNETLGRRDLVLGLSNYDKIYQDLLAIKLRLNELSIECDDKTLARWIRAAFLGESERITATDLSEAERLSMEEMIDRVAYLIHGCEAARNIAMIVVVPMLLDLVIETDEWTLAEAFTGKRNGEAMGLKARLMPMVPEGAVAAARSLESSYHGYVPHRYHYPGNQDFDGSGYKMRKEELVKYEARVVREWLRLKSGADIKVSNAEATAWVMDTILKHVNIWFEKPENARVAP